MLLPRRLQLEARREGGVRLGAEADEGGRVVVVGLEVRPETGLVRRRLVQPGPHARVLDAGRAEEGLEVGHRNDGAAPAAAAPEVSTHAFQHLFALCLPLQRCLRLFGRFQRFRRRWWWWRLPAPRPRRGCSQRRCGRDLLTIVIIVAIAVVVVILVIMVIVVVVSVVAECPGPPRSRERVLVGQPPPEICWAREASVELG